MKKQYTQMQVYNLLFKAMLNDILHINSNGLINKNKASRVCNKRCVESTWYLFTHQDEFQDILDYYSFEFNSYVERLR